jgi:RHS repeat-associated protein
VSHHITDPSGMLQLGARFYWPQIGRFIQQDPIGHGINWYAYVDSNPVTWVDPEGLVKWREIKAWYMGGMWGASDYVDQVLLGGATQRYGHTAGMYSAGSGSRWDLAKASAGWAAQLAKGAATVYVPGRVSVSVASRAFTVSTTVQVTRWGPAGRWVMKGGPTRWNYWLSGVRQLGYRFDDAATWTVPRGGLRYPPGWQWVKGIWGQRILQ